MGKRPASSILSLVITCVGVIAVIVALSSIGTRDVPHDEHFATALQLLATFESSSLMLAACGAVAVALAAGGMFVRHERGLLPSTALVAGALITVVGILGFARMA